MVCHAKDDDGYSTPPTSRNSNDSPPPAFRQGWQLGLFLNGVYRQGNTEAIHRILRNVESLRDLYFENFQLFARRWGAVSALLHLMETTLQRALAANPPTTGATHEITRRRSI